jgi:hypothetical protein
VVEVSARRRRDIIDALRRGTVPQAGLDVLAVGLDRFAGALDEDLDRVASGGAVFKAVRGDYGSGKTFFTRHLAERALQRGFAVSEVQVSETETPLHRLETVYRRVTETLRTASIPPSAFRAVLDSWFYTLEEDALEADPSLDAADGVAVGAAVGGLVERRLASVASSAPGFALALRGYGVASLSGEAATADAVAAWLGGQPHVASAAKRAAGVRGGLDHFGAMGFLQGLLTVLRDAGHPGLLLVLDEVETLQRMRGRHVRDKASTRCASGSTSVDAGRYPGLYLVMTGTPAFFDGVSRVSSAWRRSQRLHVDFGTDAALRQPASGADPPGRLRPGCPAGSRAQGPRSLC